MALGNGAGLATLTLVGAPSSAEVLAVPTRPDGDLPSVLGDVDDLGVLAREKAKGEAGEVIAVPTAERVLLVGLGDGSAGSLRKAGAAVVRRASSAASLTLDLRLVDLDASGLRALAEGLLLSGYSYTEKPSPKKRALTRIFVAVADPSALDLAPALAVVSAVAAARDLVNTPPATKSPAWLAKQAAGLLTGLTVTVRDDKALRAEGWGGVVAVGMGSSRPPRVVEATYDGGGSTHVVLVGKGITFDTGGISIKPTAGMLSMKMDMGGSAAVFATLRAVADLTLPIKVTVLGCLAENMPNGNAQRPSDVITQYGGRTVEVLNTDAEGRLVLADGIAYADRVLKADVIVDIATLTGAMPVALGQKIAGLFSSDDALAAQLVEAAEASGERVWRMPLVEDYRAGLESTTADLRNIADPKLKQQGGSIVAALFLREFAGGRPWAHLDIAGPAWVGGDDAELTKGGTGYGVRLLVSWLEALSALSVKESPVKKSPVKKKPAARR